MRLHQHALWEVDGALVLCQQRLEGSAPLACRSCASCCVCCAQVQAAAGPCELHLQVSKRSNGSGLPSLQHCLSQHLTRCSAALTR